MAEQTEKKAPTKRPSALKRDLQNEKRRIANQAFKSRVKTVLRRFEENLQKGEKGVLQKSLDSLYSLMDKGAKRGLFKQNKADRLKARAAAKVTK